MKQRAVQNKDNQIKSSQQKYKRNYDNIIRNEDTSDGHYTDEINHFTGDGYRETVRFPPTYTGAAVDSAKAQKLLPKQ